MIIKLDSGIDVWNLIINYTICGLAYFVIHVADTRHQV